MPEIKPPKPEPEPKNDQSETVILKFIIDEEPVVSELQMGWKCPVCGSGNAPSAIRCPCTSFPPPNTYIPTVSVMPPTYLPPSWPHPYPSPGQYPLYPYPGYYDPNNPNAPIYLCVN